METDSVHTIIILRLVKYLLGGDGGGDKGVDAFTLLSSHTPYKDDINSSKW